jgi:hypothetical protein
LARLEQCLPESSFVLGVDEHTAVLLDIGAGTATVLGNGTMTIRRGGRSVVHPAGTVVELGSLASVAGGTPVPAGTVAEPPQASAPEPVTSSLRAAASQASAQFDDAMARRDVDGCVSAILALEQSIMDWSADTLTSDEGDYARGQLRTMILRLGELAVIGARDPRAVVNPFVEAMLELRGRARDARDWATSDWIRDRLASAGIEVRDTHTGAQWYLSS